jgi:hypothetical protein
MTTKHTDPEPEKATAPPEYPVQPAVAPPTSARPWKLIELPSPAGGLLLLPWVPVDATVPAQSIVISPEAQARSTPIMMPPVPAEQASDAAGTAVLFAIAYRLKGPVPEPPVGTRYVEAPPGYRLERIPQPSGPVVTERKA